MNTQKYEKTVSLLHADGIHPISLRRAALLAAHGAQLQARRGAVPRVAGLRRVAVRPAVGHDRADPRMDHFPHGGGKAQRRVDEPRSGFAPGLFPLAAPHGSRRKGYFPHDFDAQNLTPPAGIRSRKPHDDHRQRVRTGQRRFPDRAQLAHHPDVLRLRTASGRAGRHRPQRLFGRLHLAAGPGQGRQTAHGPDSRIPARKDFALPRPNREAKYLHFFGKSTIFNT